MSETNSDKRLDPKTIQQPQHPQTDDQTREYTERYSETPPSPAEVVYTEQDIPEPPPPPEEADSHQGGTEDDSDS